MSYLDSSILSLYLFCIIIIGIYSGKDVKNTKDFAVGNKDFLTITLIMTIFATYVDGEIIFDGAAQGFNLGISFFYANCADFLTLIAYGFIAQRAVKFREAISVGDIVGEMYGRRAQMITGIFGFLTSASLVAVQFKALSFIFHYFYNISPDIGVWISAIILITYSALGGIRAVTWTDMIQFFILVNAVPLVTSIAVNKIGGIFELIKILPEHKFDIFPEDKDTFYKYLVYMIASVPLCSPPMIQRMIMSRNARQSRNAYWVSALISIPFFLIIAIAGIASSILNPDMDGSNAFLYLIDNFMPSGLKGFAVAGIIAIIMSTADSFMNTAAVSFSHDFLKTSMEDKLTPEREFQATKLITLVVGIIGCLTAMQFNNLIDMMLYSYMLWGPVISVPLIAGLFGIIAPKYSFYIGIVSGMSTAILWSVFKLEEAFYIHAILPALFANLLTFAACFIFEEKNEI